MARGTRSRGKKDTADTATTSVDDRTTAVDQAAAAAVAADAPEAVSSATDAVSDTTATEISTAREVDARLEGQDLALSEEQLAETIPTPDDDAGGLLGVPGVDDLKNRKPGEDLLGDEGDSSAPSDDPRERAEASKDFNPFGTAQAGGLGGAAEAGQGAGGGADAGLAGGGAGAEAIKDAGIFDLIDQPGAATSDPLSSFLGAAEAKLGHDTGLTTPGDQTNASPAHGFGIGAFATDGHVQENTVASADNGVVFTQTQTNLNAGIAVTTATTVSTTDNSPPVTSTTVTDVSNQTTTTVEPDGSTTTTNSGGEVLDETPALEGPESTIDLGKLPFTNKHLRFREGSGFVVDQPDSENEIAPIPEDIARQLDADVARLRAARPQTDDGTTDPVESDVDVRDPSAVLATPREQARELFGQPDTEAPSGSDSNFNPGADSSGAGVITPGEDQTVSTGRTRNDDPFADAGTVPEPVTSSTDDAAESQSFLPSETTGTAIDDKPDVPDPISDPA